MAQIEERKKSDGKISYRVLIRRKGIEISKTFYEYEDAKVYVYYKEKLIDNMESFDVPIEKRITILQMIELKINSIDPSNKRGLCDFDIMIEKLSKVISLDTFLDSISYEGWITIAKDLFKVPVYKHGKTEACKRNMSIVTLRKYFANISSCFSHAISLGINLENHILKVLKIYINPLLKK